MFLPGPDGVSLQQAWLLNLEELTTGLSAATAAVLTPFLPLAVIVPVTRIVSWWEAWRPGTIAAGLPTQVTLRKVGEKPASRRICVTTRAPNR